MAFLSKNISKKIFPRINYLVKAPGGFIQMKKILKAMRNIAILFIGSQFILSGCAKKENSSKESSKSQTQTEEQTINPNLNPLTGLPIGSRDPNARPIAIMINNIDRAQPLLGVSNAEIIYECPVEGGITRLMAVYKDPTDIPKIGSLRSARPYYVNLARGHDAIYIHAGGSSDADNMLNNGVLDHFNLAVYGDMAWRDEARKNNLGYEHSLVTSGKKLIEGIKKNNVRLKVDKNKTGPLFNEDSPVLNGSAAENLIAPFSTYKSTDFTYDPSKKTYLISQFNKPQMDGQANVQNSKENIIILRVKISDINKSSLKSIELTGQGEGQYMSRGKIMDIKWEKTSDDAPLKYTTTDGKPLALLPGQFYVCAVSTDAKVSVK
jgi:hypothetical protein